MRRLFESETVIDRPVDDVWAELTAWDRAPRWMNEVTSMHVEPDTRPGATVTYEARGKTHTCEITAVEPGRSLTIVNRQGGVTSQYVYAIEPEGDRTRATLTADLDVRGFPVAIFGPLIRSAIRRTDGGQLDAFRTVLESRRVEP